MSGSDRVAIVTGGAGGLGAALCEQLAAAGASVIAADIDAAGLDALAERLRGKSGQLELARVDVTDAAAVIRLVDSVCERFGRLDLMVNNAGIGIWGEVRDLPDPLWRQIFEVDFWSAVHGSRAAYARMVDQGSGHIVNVASLAGLLPAPTTAPYAAAKHALVGFSLALRAEAEDLGVRVSTVCPGPIRTGFHAALLRVGAAAPRPPAESSSAEAAAREILKGVEKNARMIVFPRRARRLWWLWRLAPGRVARINRETIRRLRRNRGAEDANS